MLNGMARLVSRHRTCRYGSAVIDALAEIYCHVLRVEMVREFAGDALDGDVVDAVLSEHQTCHIRSCEPVRAGNP